jgi:hypothetical protein
VVYLQKCVCCVFYAGVSAGLAVFYLAFGVSLTFQCHVFSYSATKGQVFHSPCVSSIQLNGASLTFHQDLSGVSLTFNCGVPLAGFHKVFHSPLLAVFHPPSYLF